MRFLAFLFYFLSLVGPDIGEIRMQYPDAVNSKAVVEKLHSDLSTVSKDDNIVLVAYKGAISSLMAKHAKGIKDKKNFFKEGVELLEYAVQEKPNDIEIRCIRIGVQEHSPKFLKYKDAIPKDKKFILEHFKTTESQEIKAFVKGFALQSTLFDDQEKQLF